MDASTVTECTFDAYDVFVELYDSVHADVTDDIASYLEEARRSAGAVLEVGCGTGRVLIPLAEAGIPVVGIDTSRHMLEICRRKVAELRPEVRERTTLVEADMRSFSSPQRFALICLPNQAFLSLLRVDDQLQALVNLRRHLRDDGMLALDFQDPDPRTIGQGLGEYRGLLRTGRVGKAVGDEITRLDNGNKVVHWFKSAYEPMTQVVDHTIVIDELEKKGNVVGRYYVHYVVRWLYRYEFEHLLVRCGFEIVGLYGSPGRESPTRSGQQLFWLARKAQVHELRDSP